VGQELATVLSVPTVCLGPDGLGPDLLAPLAEGVAAFDLDTAAGAPESIFQTTGTTGKPKLIHHGAGLYEQMSAIAEDWKATGQPLLRHFSLTPMWHAAGQATAMLNLVSGGVLFILFQFISEEYLAAIEEHRATSVYISPLMLNALLDDPALETTDCGSLKLLNVGGSPVTPARLREAIERFGPVVRMTYGLSELPFISAFPGMTDDPRHPDRLRSCGQPYGDVRIEIRDDHGTVVAPGEVGELWAASRLNFLGYWGNPELTAEMLVDGWLRTRDLGYADEDGYLHLVGRVQDLIITGLGGEHVFPRRIEEVLAASTGIRATAVIGVPDVTLGEVPHAYVVRAPDATVSVEELSALVEEKLGELWVPQVIEFVEDLPRTSNGKVDVKALKAGWAAVHGLTGIGATG
jgi:acyl-CoA synthetase (AMP-forming)/AMP-acid ligase II